MSTANARTGTAGGAVGAERLFRGAALACVLVLTAAYVSVLREVALVVGDSSNVVQVAVVTLVVATAVAAVVRERTAITAALVLLALGHLWYLRTTPATLAMVIGAWEILLADAAALLTGLSLVQLTNAEAWAVGAVPAPVFLSWYLAVRRRYAVSAAIGGATLLVLVQTGDAGTLATLAGVLGAAGAVGFGDLELRGAPLDQADAIAVAFAAMAVLSLTVTVIPAGGGSPLSFHGTSGVGGPQAGSVESGVVDASGELQFQGSVELTPEVRFTVESTEPGYWRTGTFDTYTGDSWVRTGGVREWDGRVDEPPGSTESVEQVYEFETAASAMPAVGTPVEVGDGVADETLVTTHGGLDSKRAFRAGESYRVRSLRPDASASELRLAGDDYPTTIETDYLQLPSDRPERVGRLADEITADAATPYESAVAIEGYLERQKRYSLNVERPEGDVVDSFLFEMDAGYCTYYAASMTALLREEGIPARMAVGYSTGQNVGEDRYVVRGLDAHAWVEVYFPDQGWVTFDPTPADDRQQARENSIETARASGNDAADTAESSGLEPYPDEESESETPEQTPRNRTDRSNETDPEIANATNGTAGSLEQFEESDDETDSGALAWLPPAEWFGIGLTALFGLAVLSRRTGHAARLGRAVGVRRQGRRRGPVEDVERAFERLELLLARDRRPRDPAETPREYVARVAGDGEDARVDRLRRLHERARYGGDVSAREAEEAIALVDELVAEKSRLARSTSGGSADGSNPARR